MDRTNLGQGFLSSFSAPEMPVSVQGLSKPRFLKQRKHSANSRGKPAAPASQDDSAPGFNPFQSEKLDAAPLYQAEDSRAQKVREQLYEWNPFTPVASSCANSGAGYENSSNTGPGSIQGSAFDLGKNGAGNAGTGLFLFENVMEKDSSFNCLLSQKLSVRSLGRADSSISEDALNAGSFSESNVESIEAGIAVSASVCSANAGNVFSDTDGFIFGSSSNKYGNLHHRSSLGSESSDDGSLSALNLQKLDLGSFVFKSRQMKNTHSSNNSSFGSGEGLIAEQSERTKKEDQQNFSYDDCHKADMGVYVLGGLGKTKAYSDQSSSMCFHESSFPELSEDLKKLKIVNSGKKDPDVEKKSTNASKCSSFGSFDSMFSKLPEKMEKLNLQNFADEDPRDTNSIDFVPGCSLKKGTNFNQTSTSGLDEGAFSNLHRELRKLNLQTSGNEHGDANNNVFVFGTSIKRNTISGKSSSLSFDESSFSKLSDGIGKMKLSASGNEDSYQKTKQGDLRTKHRNEDATTHRNKDATTHRNKDATTSSVASAAHKLQEKIEELKINNGTTFLKGSSDFKPGTFVVESGANNSLSSSQTSKVPYRVSRNCTSSKLQDKMRKFSVDSTANNVCLEESNKSVLGQKGDANGVIFSTTNSSSGYSGESGLRTINTDSKTADSSGRVDQVSAPGGLASYASGSSNTLQSAKEDHGCKFAALQTDDSCGCSAETASCTSSVPVFQSSTTDFIFTGLHTGIESPRTDFRNQKQDASWLTRENPFSKPYKKMTFGMKKANSKGVRLKKERGKSKISPPSHPDAKQFVSENNVLEEILEQDAFGGYSPMDYSPYQESLVPNQCSREASIAADVSIHFDSRYTSTGTRISASVDGKDEELVTETEYHDTNEGLPENEANCSKISFARHSTSECSLTDEMTSGLQKGSLIEKDENVGSGIQMRTSMESKSFSFGSSIKQPTTEGENGFTSTTPSKDVGQSNFLFAATSPVQSPLSASSHSYENKIMVNGGQDSHPKTRVPFVSTPNMFLFPNAPVATGHVQEPKGSYEYKGPGKVNDAKANRESKATAAASDAAQEACEKWRLWGNQAYEDGNLSKAEDYYTLGVKSVSLNEISKNCSRALMLCYSNRAATRMSLVRLREALGDCKMALEIDPSFLRAQVRAGNIHLSLGESRDALQHFEMCLQLDNETKSQKILLEAADGLQKAQKLKDLMDQSSVLLTKSTSSDVSKALEIITEALFISPYSESLLEMKAETLLMLRNYQEAIRLCERTLELAEKNAVITKADCQLKDINMQSLERSYVRLWRWRIISRSYFYLGKLDEANELLQKHEKEKPVIEKCGNRYPETSASFPNILRELLRLKNAGNEAFQAGRHLEAVELYTAALALNTESRPFTAVCFCNRAAAYQALGQITDAIADCSIAIALDSSYRKAISRRASLHEMIRDYGQAATDLHKLISLLEKDSEDEYNASGALGRSISNISDLNQAYMRLSTVEEEARKGATLDMYMILGLERSSSAAEVRKVYRKAALRHHPDKAVQFLARSENGDDNIWKEVAEKVHSDADNLFKMIGEAYTILVDPPKRLQYDAAEQELRTMNKGYDGSGSPRTPASNFNSRYRSSSDRNPQRT